MSAGLDEAQVAQLLLYLDPVGTARLRAVAASSVLARGAGSEALWEAHAARTFGAAGRCPAGPEGCVGPRGQVCETRWSKAFPLWYSMACELGLRDRCLSPRPAPLPGRWVAVWSRFQRWLLAQAPEVAATLRPTGDLAEEVSKLAASPLVSGLWSVFDGQETGIHHAIAQVVGLPSLGHMPNDAEWSHGIFGGYTVYDHEASTRFLPLRVALRISRDLNGGGNLHEAFRNKVVFAGSHNFEKLFLVSTVDGAVWVGNARGDLVPAHPQGPSPGKLQAGSHVRVRGLRNSPELNGRRGVAIAYSEVNGRWQVQVGGFGQKLMLEANLEAEGRAEASPGQVSDGLLRWVEEFVRRLEAGIYIRTTLKPEKAPLHAGISLFPADGVDLSRCVTNGVEVTASCVFMPENAHGGWTYCVALRLVGDARERGYLTCQLTTGSWLITAEGTEPHAVHAEGVAGLVPILADGGWHCNGQSDPNGQYGVEAPRFVPGPFRYSGCTGRIANMRGTFRGELNFVPGTRAKPTGKPFNAVISTFSLHVPGYIF